MSELRAPLQFRPVYMNVIWGGRRMTEWRSDLPEGKVGESWDLADHPRGMSVVAAGPLAGMTLRELTARYGKALVGDAYEGGDFPLMVKMIDAQDRLSVQVHPDDQLARELGVGVRGKTECWLMVKDGGELYVGTRPGTTRAHFERALAEGRVADELCKFPAKDGDFYFIAARTVHALGNGCLLYEVQQTCDITFRVDDWGRVGQDGKPRPLHVKESLQTIDYGARTGAVTAPLAPCEDGGQARPLAKCDYFQVEERRATETHGGDERACSVVICLEGEGVLETSHGHAPLRPMHTLLVPAEAGRWSARTGIPGKPMRLVVARP